MVGDKSSIELAIVASSDAIGRAGEIPVVASGALVGVVEDSAAVGEVIEDILADLAEESSKDSKRFCQIYASAKSWLPTPRLIRMSTRPPPLNPRTIELRLWQDCFKKRR